MSNFNEPIRAMILDLSYLPHMTSKLIREECIYEDTLSKKTYLITESEDWIPGCYNEVFELCLTFRLNNIVNVEFKHISGKSPGRKLLTIVSDFERDDGKTKVAVTTVTTIKDKPGEFRDFCLWPDYENNKIFMY